MITRKRLAYASLAMVAAGVIAGGSEYIAAAQANASGNGFQQEACVTFGAAHSAARNYMLYDWNDSTCPAGTYPVKLANPQPAVTVTVTTTASASASATSSATSTATPAG